MLSTEEVKNHLTGVCNKFKDPAVRSAILVHELKVISSLFGMVADIKEEYYHHGISHGFGALLTILERIPPDQIVTRSEDKQMITAAREDVWEVLDLLCKRLEDLIGGNHEVYFQVISKIYEIVNKLNLKAKYFVSMLPPIPMG